MREKTQPMSVETLLDLPRRMYDRANEMQKDATTMGRDAWLTSLGVVGIVEDEGNKLMDMVAERRQSLAKRGEKVEKRLDARVEDMKETIDFEGRRRAVTRRVETNVVDPIVGVLHRLGLPSRTEVRDLTHKVDTLTQRVNLLVTALEKQSPARPVYALRAREDGWEVILDGADAPVAVFATKDEALEKAREVASEQAPSQLVVYKKDGSIQDTIDYED